MTRLLFLSALAVALATPCVRAQTPESKVEFEVASVKPFSIAQTDGAVTLGATITKAKVRMIGLTMRDLLGMAYRVKPYEINGPDWIATERYAITAKMPPDVSAEKLPEMVQSLLNERFGLCVRRDKKEMPVYALLVGKTPL